MEGSSLYFLMSQCERGLSRQRDDLQLLENQVNECQFIRELNPKRWSKKHWKWLRWVQGEALLSLLLQATARNTLTRTWGKQQQPFKERLAAAGPAAPPVSCPGESNEGDQRKGEQGERTKTRHQLLQDYGTAYFVCYFRFTVHIVLLWRA